MAHPRSFLFALATALLLAGGARRLHLPIAGVQPVVAMDELRRLTDAPIAPELANAILQP